MESSISGVHTNVLMRLTKPWHIKKQDLGNLVVGSTVDLLISLIDDKFNIMRVKVLKKTEGTHVLFAVEEITNHAGNINSVGVYSLYTLNYSINWAFLHEGCIVTHA